MRLIDADHLIELVREEARTDLEWNEANRMLNLINECESITDVMPRPKKTKETK